MTISLQCENWKTEETYWFSIPCFFFFLCDSLRRRWSELPNDVRTQYPTLIFLFILRSYTYDEFKYLIIRMHICTCVCNFNAMMCSRIRRTAGFLRYLVTSSRGEYTTIYFGGPAAPTAARLGAAGHEWGGWMETQT